MILNTIKSTVQSFLNFKVYTLINLFGLILGITCSAVIFLYVNFEYSYDSFHKDKDRIFRVNEISTSPKDIHISPSLRVAYGPALKNEISEIEDVVRLRNNWHVNSLKYNDKVIALENAIFADSNLFSFFTFNIISGQPNQLLATKNSIVLTQTISILLFGNENPLGKIVEYDNNTYVITGIVADVPLNSHIQFDAVFSLDNYLNSPDVYLGWDGGMSAATFVKLFSSDLEIEVEKKMPDFLWDKINKKNENTGFLSEFYLEPMNQIHLFSKVDWDSNKKEGKYVLILLLIGILILLIAVINYLFISNGTLTLRLKEFSIKHYFGLDEFGIAKQIFTDSLILFILSGIISVIIISGLESQISELFDVDFLSFQLKKNIFLLAIVIIVISSITSFIQFVIYKRKIINSPVVGQYSSPFLLKKLVYISALQFCISIALISSMMIVYMQLNYALQKDLGFASKNIINISHGSIGVKQKMLINEISKLPTVANVSASFGIPGLETTANGYKPQGEEQYQIFSALYVDDNFFNTFQLELIQGRNFREGLNADIKKIIINETLAKQLNWNPAVGKSIYREDNYEVIGVVKDFHVGLIYNKIPPLIISKEGANNFYSLSIALTPGATSQTIKQIEKLWNNIIPAVPFNYSFMDSKFESLYSEIKQTVAILFLFTSISILVSILGLFGITFLLINSKVKEIGIRKVNGASIIEIMKILNYNFVKWFAIAFVIAVPISWYTMNLWLQSFAYRIDQSWWIFALAGVFALSIILLTVSWQSWQAANKNPIKALRYE